MCSALPVRSGIASGESAAVRRKDRVRAHHVRAAAPEPASPAVGAFNAAQKDRHRTRARKPMPQRGADMLPMATGDMRPFLRCACRVRDPDAPLPAPYVRAEPGSRHVREWRSAIPLCGPARRPSPRARSHGIPVREGRVDSCPVTAIPRFRKPKNRTRPDRLKAQPGPGVRRKPRNALDIQGPTPRLRMARCQAMTEGHGASLAPVMPKRPRAPLPRAADMPSNSRAHACAKARAPPGVIPATSGERIAPPGKRPKAAEAWLSPERSHEAYATFDEMRPGTG